ncbi:hypothetical protein BN1013_00801 [Candidatus Rubidus massiliensis]|nr:hypothetical protein BN1013_00801 [Candidatus Rubidus massiliensis]
MSVEANFFSSDPSLNQYFQTLLTLNDTQTVAFDSKDKKFKPCKKVQNEQIVKTYTNSLLKNLNKEFLEKCDSLTILKLKQALSKLPKNIFDRSLITEEIEDVFSPDLKLKKQTFANAKFLNLNTIEGRRAFKEAEIALRIEEVRLAQSLGIEFEAISEGANGSYFGFNKFGKKIIVYKPASEEEGNCTPKLSSKFKAFLKKILFFFFSRLKPRFSLSNGSNYKREILASEFATVLDLPIVPNTSEARFASKKFYNQGSQVGSCQLFMPNSDSGEGVYKLPTFLPLPMQLFIRKLNKSKNPILPPQYLQMLVFLDYLIGNIDRHFGNFLAEVKNGVIKNLHAIDNSNSMLPIHVEGYVETKHFSPIVKLDEAKEFFLPEILDRFEKVKENFVILDQIAQKILGSEYTQKQKNGESCRDCFKQRCMIIANKIDHTGKPIKTPIDLVNCFKRSQIHKTITKISKLTNSIMFA